MSYLKHEPVTVTKLTCSHPKVKRIWEWGGLSVNDVTSDPLHYVGMIMENDDRLEFKITDLNYSNVEEFLSQLQ